MLQTSSAATEMMQATSNALTATSTVTPTPIPPTATASATPTTPPPTGTPTATLDSTIMAGTIYYIYNGDAILAVAGDGSREEFLYTVGVGVPIEYLTPSPNGEWLAFVAPGSGSAREVWIMNRDATYTQMVSCLGFADVRLPGWSPDNEWLAFFATQSPNGPLDLYTAKRTGPICGEDSHRQLADLNSLSVGGLAYAQYGNRLFFSNVVIYAIDLTTGEISPALTQNTGFGADYALQFNPAEPFLLTYLQVAPLLTPIRNEGLLYAIDISRPDGILTPELAMRSLLLSFQWSSDGESLLLSSPSSVSIIGRDSQTGPVLASGLTLPPQAIFNPTADQIAYIDADPNNPTTPQIYIVDRNGRDSWPITHNPEGSIQDLVWLTGGW